jgi:hypothetical protein
MSLLVLCIVTISITLRGIMPVTPITKATKSQSLSVKLGSTNKRKDTGSHLAYPVHILSNLYHIPVVIFMSFFLPIHPHIMLYNGLEDWRQNVTHSESSSRSLIIQDQTYSPSPTTCSNSPALSDTDLSVSSHEVPNYELETVATVGAIPTLVCLLS